MGHLNVLESYFLEFNYSEDLHELYKMLGVENGIRAREKFENLMDSVGLERRFESLGITKDFSDVLVNNVNLERLTNNPRKVNEENIRKILHTD